MPDDDLDFRIRISTPADTSGAESAQRAIDGLVKSTGDVGEAGEAGAKGLRRMIEEAGTVREAQRIAQGFFDVFLGGGRTIEGTAEIMRFFIATAADINPLFATIAVLGSSLAVVAGRQGEHNKEMADGKDKADALEQSISLLNAQIKGTADAQADSVRQIGDEQDQAASVLSEMAKADAARTASLASQLELQQKITQATLENARATALASNSGGAAGAQQINEYFDTQEEASSAASVRQRLQIIARSHQQQRAQVEANLTREQENQAGLKSSLLGVYQAAPRAQSLASSVGVYPDAKGSYDDAIGDLKKKIDEAGKRLEGDQQGKNSELNTLVLSGPEKEEAYAGVLQNDRVVLRALTFALDLAKKAALATQSVATVAPDLQKQVESSAKRIEELSAQAKALSATIQTDRLDQDKAAADARKSAQDLARKQALDQQAIDNRNFEADNGQQVRAQELIATDEDRAPSTRVAALREENRLRNAGLQRKIDQGTQTGVGAPDKPLTQTEIASLAKQMADNTAATEKAIRELGDKLAGVSADQKPQFDQANAALQALVDRGSAIVNRSNNTAARDQLGQAGDLAGRAGFLGDLFQGSGDPTENLLSRQIGDALRDRAQASPAATGKGARGDQRAFDTDDLTRALATATDRAGQDGFVQLKATIDRSIDLHEKTVALVEGTKASSDSKLLALVQRVSALETRRNNDNNHN